MSREKSKDKKTQTRVLEKEIGTTYSSFFMQLLTTYI